MPIPFPRSLSHRSRCAPARTHGRDIILTDGRYHKISRQECTSIMRSLHHSFNVFNTRRDVQTTGGWHCRVTRGLRKLRGHEARAILSWLPHYAPHRRPPLPRHTYASTHKHKRTVCSHTHTEHMCVHVSSEFGPSLFMFTLTLACSHLQPSAGSLYPSYLLSFPTPRLPFFTFYALPLAESPTETKETESRLQTGVVLIKLLKRTCIQEWFRAGCSYIQPPAANAWKDA